MKAEQAWQAALGQLQMEMPKASLRYLGQRRRVCFL